MKHQIKIKIGKHNQMIQSILLTKNEPGSGNQRDLHQMMKPRM